jgi:thiamine biosynthesis lipoprotein
VSNRGKNVLYSLILLTAVFVVWMIRKPPAPEPLFIEGETMATTYHVTYFDRDRRDFSKQLDSLLVSVNLAINNYDSASEVSRFNRSARGLRIESEWFRQILAAAKEVHAKSEGAYDPTVMPLVNAWGFGPGRKLEPDSRIIDSLVLLVGLDKVRFAGDSVLKSDPRVQLDFGGIGQGFGADVLADFLEAQGVTDYLVELGGEGRAAGRHLSRGRSWNIGILDPESDPVAMSFYAELTLEEEAFTTSGNYFNYRIVDGKKISHTIDPHTGRPVERRILSATVLAPRCTPADAWATAFMVMGHERGIETARAAGLDVLFIFTGDDGAKTPYVSERIRTRVQLKQP